jgi:sugar-specific transcriptional regulator TrmB
MSNRIDDSEKKSLIANLELLGLTAKEAAVYLALLSMDQVGSSKIMKATNLHGQFVYAALEQLEQKNLAFHTIQNGRKKFSASSPKRILSLLQQQALVADETVKRLESFAPHNGKQRFEIYQGDIAYVEHEFERLIQTASGSTLCIIGGQDDAFAKLMSSRKEEYERLRQKKGILIRYLGSEVQKQELADTKKRRPKFDYRIIPGFSAGMVNTDIWTDNISFNLFGDPTIVFHLKNKDVADSYRKFFDAIWTMGKE